MQLTNIEAVLIEIINSIITARAAAEDISSHNRAVLLTGRQLKSTRIKLSTDIEFFVKRVPKSNWRYIPHFQKIVTYCCGAGAQKKSKSNASKNILIFLNFQLKVFFKDIKNHTLNLSGYEAQTTLRLLKQSISTYYDWGNGKIPELLLKVFVNVSLGREWNANIDEPNAVEYGFERNKGNGRWVIEGGQQQYLSDLETYNKLKNLWQN